MEFPWPTCRMHYDLLTDNFDFYDWVWNAQYDPHGTVHVWMGGILDCQGAYAEINSLVGEAIGAKFASMAFIHRKDLFRDGLFTCRTPPSETRGASGFHTSAGARAGEDHLKPRTSRTAAANTKVRLLSFNKPSVNLLLLLLIVVIDHSQPSACCLSSSYSSLLS